MHAKIFRYIYERKSYLIEVYNEHNLVKSVRGRSIRIDGDKVRNDDFILKSQTLCFRDAEPSEINYYYRIINKSPKTEEFPIY